MNKISGLYRIINKTNNKFYIGSSDDIHRRWRDGHINLLEKNKHDNQHLQNAWNKYGKDNFIFEIYRDCDPINLLTEEQKELDAWVGNLLCYNMRKSAECPIFPGEHRSEEVKKKISLAQKGKTRWTEEQRKQMSIDRKGRKHSPETIKKFKNRPKSCYTGIVKAQKLNKVRIYTPDHCRNISLGKLKKIKGI